MINLSIYTRALKMMRNTVHIDRNNTNFTSQLLAYFQKATWGTEYDFLKYYQNVVRLFVRDIDIGAKGLLIYHDMGFGKSILGVSIAIDMIKERQPIMLLTKSLQGNMRQSIIKYVNLRAKNDPEFYLGRLNDEDLNLWIDRNFSFVSMNAGNMLKQMNKVTVGSVTEDFDNALEIRMGEVLKLGTLNGKMLIIDEAHNFLRAITNGSKNAIGLYEMIMSSNDLFTLLLTGTPIASNPFELVPCFNMIGNRNGMPILPENYHDFTKFFVGDGMIKNKEKFQNRIMGLVSRINASSTPGASINKNSTNQSASSDFPEELPMIIERVNMDADQYVSYQLARDKEKEENSRGRRRHETPAMTKPKSDASSTYRVKSRQIGNYSAPSSNVVTHNDSISIVTSPKFQAINKNINLHPDQPGLVYSQFTGMGGLGAFSQYLNQNGWELYSGRNDIITDSSPGMPAVEKYLADIDTELMKTGGVMPWWAVPETDVGLHSDMVGGCPFVMTFGETSGGNDNELIDGKNIKIVSAVLVDNYLDIISALNPNQDSLGDVRPEDILIIYEESMPVGYIVFGAAVTYEYYMNLSPEVSRELVSEMAAKIIGDLRSARGGNDVIEQLPQQGRKMKYAIISGEIPIEMRDHIVATYNSDENMHGGVIDLLLVSSTGAEGLDLKNGRHVHIMEMYWTWGRIMQVIRRLVRNGSHLALPPNERTVQPYIYLAIPPKTEMLHDGTYPDTTDVELFNEAVREQVCNESFLEAIEEVSIECMLNLGSHCRSCNPTGVKLFTNDINEIEKDISRPDPCSKLSEETIKAMEVTLDGITYHYIADSSSIYNYRIFVFDEKINSHRPMRESDPKYEKIIEAILKTLGKDFTGSYAGCDDSVYKQPIEDFSIDSFLHRTDDQY